MFEAYLRISFGIRGRQRWMRQSCHEGTHPAANMGFPLQSSMMKWDEDIEKHW